MWLAFDFAVYLVHLAFHMAPMLWRMHRLHHADRDVDVSTAVRFHPQALLSTPVKLAVIVVLGAPVLVVVIVETADRSLLLFNHASVRIPLAADRVLRFFHCHFRHARRAPFGADARDE